MQNDIEIGKQPQARAKKLAYENKNTPSMGCCLHFHLHKPTIIKFLGK